MLTVPPAGQHSQVKRSVVDAFQMAHGLWALQPRLREQWPRLAGLSRGQGIRALRSLSLPVARASRLWWWEQIQNAAASGWAGAVIFVAGLRGRVR
jgi:hypothetical protein